MRLRDMTRAGRGTPPRIWLRMMHVVIRLFAGLRERAGTGARALELADGARVGDVWSALELGNEPPGLLYAINKIYADARVRALRGRRGRADPARLGRRLQAVGRAALAGRGRQQVARDEAGAIATFIGTVRNRSRDRAVICLEYEAYEGMAEDVMAQLAAELADRHELSAIAIHHRVGRVEIGEPSVVIAVSSPHRADALAACKEAIDTLKETVPLWKKEVYEGGEEWIGQGS